MIANFRGDGHPARLDGPAAAGHRGGDRAARRATASRAARRRASSCVERPASRASSRCGRAGRRCSAATCTRRSATAKCFAGGWYLTGDLARRDADGYFWFVGRADDVIKSVGPPDRPVRGRERADGAPGGRRGRRDRQARPGRRRGREGVRRRCKPGFEPSDALRRELLGFARKRLGAAVAPKEIEFVAIAARRRAAARSCAACCKARELGLPEGDLSTLESGA